MAEAEVKKERIQLLVLLAEMILCIVLYFWMTALNEGAFSWKRVAMDGSRTGVESVTQDNVGTALGVFDDDMYTAPSGLVTELDDPLAESAAILMECQGRLAPLKEVVGHSAKMMMNLRTQPDLPLPNLFADILRAKGSEYFGVPMDFAITNYGGIRVPMPKGAITKEDISNMFPFENYMVYAKVSGEGLLSLFNQLAQTEAFQAVSGARILVRDHQLVEALIGGEPVDPERIYNVTTIDFLLGGGDRIAIGAIASDVVLTHVLLKDIMFEYVEKCEAQGIVIDSEPDGRVVMEES